MPIADTKRGSSLPAAPDRVYQDLRAEIINFDLPPDTTLSRNDLTKRFGVSQTPLREALQKLESEGLILIFPQSKTVVSKIDVRQLSEVQFLRVSIETEVVRRLATQRNDAVLQRAQSILNMQKTLDESEVNMPLFTELDRSFHLCLFEGVGMESVHAMLQERLGQLFRCQRLELPGNGKMKNIVEAHQAIMDGLAAGDEEAAVSAIREHLSGTITRVESLRSEFPEYFTDDEFR